MTSTPATPTPRTSAALSLASTNSPATMSTHQALTVKTSFKSTGQLKVALINARVACVQTGAFDTEAGPGTGINCLDNDNMISVSFVVYDNAVDRDQARAESATEAPSIGSVLGEMFDVECYTTAGCAQLAAAFGPGYHKTAPEPPAVVTTPDPALETADEGVSYETFLCSDSSGALVSFASPQGAWAAKVVLNGCKAIIIATTFTQDETRALATAYGEDRIDDSNGLGTLWGMCLEQDGGFSSIIYKRRLNNSQVAEVKGMLILCPDHPDKVVLTEALTGVATATSQASTGATSASSQTLTPVSAAASADASDTQFADGTYTVGKDIKPGTYAIEGKVVGCYWERLDSSGEIIDNNFVDSAPRVQVTIRKSDFAFHSENCGTWTLVK